MAKNRYVTAVLAILLGGYSLYMPTSPWTIAGTIIAGIILLFVLRDFICREIKRRRIIKSLEDPFVFYYEPADDKREYSKEIYTSPQKQYCESTIQIKVDLHMEFISLRFDGMGKQPEIHHINDHRGIEHHNVHLDRTKDNVFYMTFDPPCHRPASARIRLGLTYVATEPFDGYIVAVLAASEVAYRTNKLKLTVSKS